MKKTKLCEVLGIEYPLINGAMDYIAGTELAAAVSNAGGMGTMASNAEATREMRESNIQRKEVIRRNIRKIRTLTNKPWALNFQLHDDPNWPTAQVMEDMHVAVDEGMKIAVCTTGDPSLYCKYLKDNGVKIIMVGGHPKHAVKAEAEGVDVFVCEGSGEAGGFKSKYELTTLVLTPLCAQAVKIPVVSAGGIADGRAMAACLALGAQGVQIGTRFIATPEAWCVQGFKDMIVAAGPESTVTLGRLPTAPRYYGFSRVLRNKFAEQVLAEDMKGITDKWFERLRDRWKKAPRGFIDGDLDNSPLYAGQCCALVKEIKPAGDVVREIVTEASAILKQLGKEM